MKTLRFFFPLVLLIASFTYGQSVRPTDLAKDLAKQIEIKPTQFTSSSFSPASTTEQKIVLSYFDPGTTPLTWDCPANYGSFLLLFLAQRFTCPGSGGFLDTIEVRIDNPTGGLVRLAEYDVNTYTDANGRKFYIPNLNYTLGDTMIDASSFIAGQMTKIPVYHTLGGMWQVPRNFFISVEYTVDGTGANNNFQIVTDSKTRAARLTDSSRSVMIYQAGSGAGITIMDSIFTTPAPESKLLYPDLYMRCYLRTTDPLGPVITSVPPATAQVGKLYTYTLQASGTPPPTYSLMKEPAGFRVTPSGIATWVPSFDQAGVFTVVIRATNSAGTYDQTFDITVTPGPGAPKITSTPVLTAKEGVDYSYQVQVTGVPTLNYSLTKKPIGGNKTMQINGSGLITWNPKPIHIGNDSVVVRATNTDGMDEQTFVIVVTGNVSPPIFTSTPSPEAIAGLQYTYNAIATGKPNPTFGLVQSPTGMTIDSLSGRITWTPARQQKGDQNVVVRAVNIGGSVDQTFKITVYTIPQITSFPPNKAKVSELYSYDVTADAFPAAHFKLEKGPNGMTIDTIAGAIRWTPTATDTGYKELRVRATNRAGDQSTHTDSIYVEGIPSSVASDNMPKLFTLHQNYPNPFSGLTKISFTLSQSNSNVLLKIFDALGREVTSLINEVLPQGEHTVEFKPTTMLNNGTYFYQLRVDSNVQTRVMHYVR